MDDDVRCNGYCFPSIVRCDYNDDCPDGTDEEGCNGRSKVVTMDEQLGSIPGTCAYFDSYTLLQLSD